jgi:uncharacterized surface protein with fasciclin (FAS1) repeats
MSKATIKNLGSLWVLTALIVLAVGSGNGGSGGGSSSSGGSSAGPSEGSNPSQKVYKEGDSVSIGYTSYCVWRSWWSNHLSDNEYLDQQPDARFLFVELTVRNDDKKPRSIPPFELVDENGATYETSDKGWAVEGSIGFFDSLNPSVHKQGFLVFDVPPSHKFKLKVSGGYWSGEDALIALSPRKSPTAPAESTPPPKPAPTPTPAPAPVPDKEKTIMDRSSDWKNMSTFCKLVEASGLAETLKGDGPFTVFLPPNKAFENMGQGAVDELLKPENKEKLVALLKYHIVAGTIMYDDISNATTLKTLGGAEIKITNHGNYVTLGDKANIISRDVKCKNGVIHIIDGVLVPPKPAP